MVVPILEIYVIIQVGQVIGAVVDDPAADRRQHLRRLADRARGSARLAGAEHGARLAAGCRPRELADGALILVGGTLMLSPGFVTDVLGILLILPFTRPVARRVLTRVVARRLLDVRRPGPGPQGPVVRGEVSTTTTSGREQLAAPVAPLTARTPSVDGLRSGLALDARLAFARCRWAGPISPSRSSSRRSLRMSSSSFSERRSSSMSQWVRAGFSAFSSGTDARRAERLGAAARALPHRRHLGLDRHRDLELVTVHAAVAGLLTGRELDAALVLEALSSQPRSTQCALCHEVHLQRSVVPGTPRGVHRQDVRTPYS